MSTRKTSMQHAKMVEMLLHTYTKCLPHLVSSSKFLTYLGICSSTLNPGQEKVCTSLEIIVKRLLLWGLLVWNMIQYRVDKQLTSLFIFFRSFKLQLLNGTWKCDYMLIKLLTIMFNELPDVTFELSKKQIVKNVRFYIFKNFKIHISEYQLFMVWRHVTGFHLDEANVIGIYTFCAIRFSK